MNIDPEVVKEPRGFIKFLEIILAICAFATATGPHLISSSSCVCSTNPNMSTSNDRLTFTYPYKINTVTFKLPTCTGSEGNGTTSEPPPVTVVSLSGDCQSSSEFYVFVGVVVFLYSLGAIILYVVGHEYYSAFGIIPKTDFLVTLLFALLWLISSSVFADALTKIKHYTDLGCSDGLQTICKDHSSVKCLATESPNYATLNVSVIFGFLNLIVWAGNAWFLYKETSWFGSDAPQQPMPPTSTAHVEPKV